MVVDKQDSTAGGPGFTGAAGPDKAPPRSRRDRPGQASADVGLLARNAEKLTGILECAADPDFSADLPRLIKVAAGKTGLSEGDVAAMVEALVRIVSGLRNEKGALSRPEERVEARVQGSSLAERFQELVAQWRSDVAFLSSITRKLLHPAYQQIIGLGPRVVPLIVRELEAKPDHWFWALKAITGEDPVPEEARGDYRAMRVAWLEWARARGYG